MTLRRTEEGFFEIDVRAALDSCSARADAQAAFSELMVENAGHVLLLPAPRARFLASLLRIFASNRVAWLASNEKTLARSSAPPARLGRASVQNAQAGTIRLLPEQEFLALLTSGTTGVPQIFRKNPRQILGEALILKEMLALTAKDVVLSSTAPHHVYGLLFSVFAPWAAGARVVTHPDNEPEAFHPEKIARLVAESGVTRLITVPAHLKALSAAQVRLDGVETIVSSAAPLDPEDAKRATDLFGAQVIDVLGSTETGGIATRKPAQNPAYFPLPGIELRTNEEEALFIRSPFLEDPLQEWESADRARLQPDGTFLHLGRVDGVVKVGGKRTSLQEIENLARTLDGVRDAVCLTRPVAGLRGQEILLVIEGEQVSRPSIKSALKRSLDPVFVPRRIRITPRLPRTDRGKLDRSALLELFGTKMNPDEPDHVEIQLAPLSSSPRFEGHFPGNELLPALAQLSDLILPRIRQHFGGEDLAELTRVKWTDPIRQSDDLFLILDRKPTGIKFELRANRSHGTVVTCSGSLALHPANPSGETGSK